MIQVDVNQWFVSMSPSYKHGLRLLCIPNSGGSPALFRTWSSLLPANIGVFSAQLPGQGTRLREQPAVRVSALVADLCAAIESYLDEPFALFGYSMGALLAFELARSLRRQGLSQPLHLFVASRRAPQTPESLPLLHPLPDELFIRSVQARYGGIPSAILQDQELMAIFMPVLRANFTMIETYQYNDEMRFEFPLTAFSGASDPTTSEAQVRAWGEQTRGNFHYHIYEGDHFFIQEHEQSVLEVVSSSLRPFLI